MPNLKFQSPEGKVITIDSPDGSIPSEQELDQLFALDTSSVSQPQQQGADLSSLQNPSEIMSVYMIDGENLHTLVDSVKFDFNIKIYVNFCCFCLFHFKM
jgi:hypothetical protein